MKWISAGGGKEGDLPLGNDPNVLIPRFGWVRDGLLWAMALNRLQNRLDIYFIDVQERQVAACSQRDHRRLDRLLRIDFELLTSGDRFLWTSWRDGHYHIYLYQFDKQNPLAAEAKLVAQLTQGDWEVESIDAVDDAAGVVYFTANEGDWRQANVFAVGLDGKNFHRVSKENGTHGPNFGPAKSKSLRGHLLRSHDAATLVVVHDRWQRATRSGSHGALTPTTCIAPKPVEFKAADGTTTLLGTLLLPTCWADDGQRQSAAHSESLRRTGRAKRP